MTSAEFVKGYLEEMPLAGESVDVVISNCVVNPSADKPKALREAARVLRTGGRFAVSDAITDEGMDETTKADMEQWTGCIAGALTEAEFRAQLEAVGLSAVEVEPTHRVCSHASAANHQSCQASGPVGSGPGLARERRENLLVVLGGLDLAENMADLAVRIDQKGRALVAHVVAAVHRCLQGDENNFTAAAVSWSGDVAGEGART